MDFGKVLRNTSGALQRSPTKLQMPFLEQRSITINSILVIFQLQNFKPHVPEPPTQCILVCLRSASGDILEISQNGDYGYNTEHTRSIPNTLRIHLGDILKYYSTL